MLGEWWKANELPTTALLSPAQVEQVLGKIAQLEWQGRPL